MKKPELLIPAGDLEKLQTAVRFGADAVYVGAGQYSLRAQQTSFSINDLKKGVKFAHDKKVKVYLALNIFAFDEDIKGMMAYLGQAIKTGIDAVIVSDAGIVALIRSKYKKLKIHLSTQSNTINSEAVKFWKKNGVKRVVLGREVSLAQASKIKNKLPKVELELFVHGAMCMSYSGRCLLSKHMTGRSANRGECSHPCRWEYKLKEMERPNEEFSIEEDMRGTYIMNSKDLNMIEHIPELIKAGIDSFKVEGRMKTTYYVALVTKIYRKAIDGYMAGPRKYKVDPMWKEELQKVSHRRYSTGFYFGEKGSESIKFGGNVRSYDFVGVVHNQKGDRLLVKARNYFGIRDELEIIDPSRDDIQAFRIKEIDKVEGEKVDSAHNRFNVYVKGNFAGDVSKFSLLRRKRR